MRWILCAVLVILTSQAVHAEQPGIKTQLVLATVRIVNPKSSATGFILTRAATEEAPAAQVLITSAHVFEKAEGEEVTLLFRRRDEDGQFTKLPTKLKIRQETRALWKKHAQQDVAAIAIELPEKAEAPALPIDLLASNDDLGRIEPGDLVRSICFPHAAIFDPSAAAFPIVRLGCIASYPIRPTAKQPTFLIDCNTFEGDSGGLVYWPDTNQEASGAGVKIVGLVQGQHFVNLRYDFPYESGEIRKQLGLAIVIPASAIRETVEQLTKK